MSARSASRSASRTRAAASRVSFGSCGAAFLAALRRSARSWYGVSRSVWTGPPLVGAARAGAGAGSAAGSPGAAGSEPNPPPARRSSPGGTGAQPSSRDAVGQGVDEVLQRLQLAFLVATDRPRQRRGRGVLRGNGQPLERLVERDLPGLGGDVVAGVAKDDLGA